MARKLSSIAPDWWDHTTLDPELIRDAAALTPQKMAKLARPGFKVVFYELSRSFTWPKCWRTSPPGYDPQIIRWAFAAQSDQPSNCRWS